MKNLMLATATVLALSSTAVLAQSSIENPGLNGATLGNSQPGVTAGVPYPAQGGTTGAAGVQRPATRRDGAQPAGNDDNSNSAMAAPHSSISPGQRNESNGP
jgi:hypothetical protein